jgi:carboxymethylenebutenolidase
MLSMTTRNFVCVRAMALAAAAASAMWAPVAAQEWAAKRLENSPRHGEYVKVKNGKREINAFIVYPEVADKAHAVVVIHDISAMGDWIRGVCDQLAEAGYIAIVPDLLSGMGPDGGDTKSFATIDDARKAVAELPPDQVTADLNAAADYVKKLPAAKGTFSIAGFCWGGGQALRYATNNSDLSAAFVFYGYEPIDAKGVARIDFPVYGFYAENDARINAAFPEVKKLFAEAEKTIEPVTYKGAGHGFMRHGEDPAGTPANKKARDDAWVRWKKILEGL